MPFSKTCAYVIVPIYLFIVRNHATEPNRKSRKAKKWPLSCGAAGDAAEHGLNVTALGHASRAWPWGGLSPSSSTGLEGWVVSAHHGLALFTSSLYEGKCTRRKMLEVVKSRGPQEALDWQEGGIWSLHMIRLAFTQSINYRLDVEEIEYVKRLLTIKILLVH